MPKPAAAIELHLYCHGLGDCHLLKIPTAAGSDWIMIDCGVHTSMRGGAERVKLVVDDVKAKTKGKLRAIAGTHEHWDHISAFHPAQKLFEKGWTIDQVWLAWTENDGNAEAAGIDKYKSEATRTLMIAQDKIAQDKGKMAQDEAQVQGLAELHSSVASVLGFLGFDSPGGALGKSFGLEGDRVRAARDRLKALGTPDYLDPGRVLDLSDEVRCYVLGPPHNSKFSKLDDKDLTYSAAANEPLLSALQNALAIKELEDDPTSPFDGDEGVPLDRARKEEPVASFLRDHYDNETWRTVDHDWLMPTSELALQLDKKTNNTSLVLAFELVKSRNVLIFAADAQIGNWQSWQTVVFPAKGDRPRTTGKDLLERAVFYKVGHHGSRNATMSVGGLELMDKLEIAFNPTDEFMAKNVKWEDIPARKLNDELLRRTSKRLIQGDKVNDLDMKLFTAGGALGTDVKVEVLRKGTGEDNPDIACVVCRIV